MAAFMEWTLMWQCCGIKMQDNQLSLVPHFTEFCQQVSREPRLFKWFLERELNLASFLEETSGCLIFTAVIPEELHTRSCQKFVEM